MLGLRWSVLHMGDALRGSILLFALTLCGACHATGAAERAFRPDQVLVLGTLHGGHLQSAGYGLPQLKELLRSLDPDVVLCEIPPDRFDQAWGEFVRDGEVREERVVLYPEFTQVLFPLALERGFEIVPCSAWTREMADARRKALAEWAQTRPQETREVNEAQARADERLEAAGLSDTPGGVHDARYDEIVAEGMEPYERLFSEDLGPGGWTQINLDHAALVNAALDERAGLGLHVLVIFGTWHKYRLRQLLAERDDIELIDLETALARWGPQD